MGEVERGAGEEGREGGRRPIQRKRSVCLKMLDAFGSDFTVY